MTKDKNDFLADLHEINTLFLLLRDAYYSSEEKNKFPHHISYIIKILEKRIYSLLNDYDDFLVT